MLDQPLTRITNKENSCKLNQKLKGICYKRHLRNKVSLTDSCEQLYALNLRILKKIKQLS